MLPTRKSVQRSSWQVTKWYGHVSRSSDLAKIILQGTVKDGRRCEEATLGNGQAQRAIENRENWRKMFVKLSVVPKRPPQLKDRWR